MSVEPNIEEFTWSPDDPLAEEHALVKAWVDEAGNAVNSCGRFLGIQLKDTLSGQEILNASPESARRLILSAISFSQFFVRLMKSYLDEDPSRRPEYSYGSYFYKLDIRHEIAVSVIAVLTRRALSFERLELLQIVKWCNDAERRLYRFPVASITSALQRYLGSAESMDDELHAELKRFSQRLREFHEKKFCNLAATIEKVIAKFEYKGGDIVEPSFPIQPKPRPASVGQRDVLVELKQYLNISQPGPSAETGVLGPDRFPLVEGSSLRAEHELISNFLEEMFSETRAYANPDLSRFKSGRNIIALSPAARGRVVLAAAERSIQMQLARTFFSADVRHWQEMYAADELAVTIYSLPFELPRIAVFDMLLFLAFHATRHQSSFDRLKSNLLDMAEKCVAESPPTEGERYVLFLLRSSLIKVPQFASPSDDINRLNRMINDGEVFCLVPGEAWADAANAEITQMSPIGRAKWAEFFEHAHTATTSRPSNKWLKAAVKLLDAINATAVTESLERWLPLVSERNSLFRLDAPVYGHRGPTDLMNDENATILRGLLWMVPLLPERDALARHVTTVALSAYKKLPGVGPRAVKVGNAAVYALSELASTEAVGQLAMLKVRVKFGSAQKEIEKAFNSAAEALGIPRDDIEEMGVPSYGLEEGGVLRETLGDYTAEILVTGSTAKLAFSDAKGKTLKSVPAKVKQDHKDEFKELQQSVKDIQGMLPAQRDRIDSMFLLQNSWPIATWRERYLQHPLVGTIASRLLWCVDGTPVLFIDGEPTDAAGKNIAHGKTAEITLWHPVGRSIDEITGWRRRIEELAITQPFKQAHREVYLLTDAERNTRTYSNRYAAHVIRQHQFNALCQARGWKNQLRLMVDQNYEPAHKKLPLWNLRAEFWIEGIGDGYGDDTNETGTYLRLATDQVRFYRLEAATNYAHAGGGGYGRYGIDAGTNAVNEPLPLEEIPPLVFSEIMRDVDLFVGVASVGNDPTWQDGGPGGRYVDYWQNYSFGNLSGTATTRKQVLERLVPRLKIADRCSFSDRFLVVRGNKRTYKIHLGSGNILMEPNDQYLCIVPDARARAKQDDLYLPFEGDPTLSIIISKALLLAADDKIKDPTISAQIG